MPPVSGGEALSGAKAESSSSCPLEGIVSDDTSESSDSSSLSNSELKYLAGRQTSNPWGREASPSSNLAWRRPHPRATTVVNRGSLVPRLVVLLLGNRLTGELRLDVPLHDTEKLAPTDRVVSSISGQFSE